MCVFAMHEGLRKATYGTVSQPGSVRIYSLKFYEGTTLVVDLVGAVRNSDGTTGLWDRVAGHFHPAPGMDHGDAVGPLGDAPTVAQLAQASDVGCVADNLTDRRMWRASVPLDRLEDGQKLTVTPRYTVTSSEQTANLPGWNDTNSNSQVYLKLTLADGTQTEWIPCYYMGATRLGTHYGAGNPVLLTYRENVFVGATDTTAGNAIMRAFHSDPSYYSNTNDYDRILHKNGVSADSAITAKHLICGGDNGYHHVSAGTTFDLCYPVLYASAAISVDTPASTTYEAMPSVDFSITGQIASAAEYSTVYLKGTVSGNTFAVAASPFLTCATPTTEDGHAYMPVGMLGGSITTGYFSTTGQLWCYKDGAFGPVSIREAAEAAKTATNYITADASGIKIHMQGNDTTYQRQTSTETTWYVSGAKRSEVSADGLKVYIGDEGEEVQVANFGATAQIGKSDESHMLLDYHSMRMEDSDGETYLYISDRRDTNGFITDTFVGDGSTKSFFLTANAMYRSTIPHYDYTVTVDGSQASGISKTQMSVVFTTAPTNGAIVTVYYEPSEYDAPFVKAYTFGVADPYATFGQMSVREGYQTSATNHYGHAEGNSTASRGMGSHAEGENTIAGGAGSHAEGESTVTGSIGAHAEGGYTEASGDYSHAQNYHTVAASNNQTVIGKFNDNDPANAFEIGNGTANNARSNALTVTWTGIVNAAGAALSGALSAASATIGGLLSATKATITKDSSDTGTTALAINDGTDDVLTVDWSGNVEAAGTVTATLQEDIVTASTDITTGNVNRCWHNGVVCTISLACNLVSSLANGGTVTVGTVPIGYRPPYTVYGSVYNNTAGGGGVRGYLTSAGAIVVRNLSGTTLDSTANLYIGFTFAL